jgi:hypothetical protein
MARSTLIAITLAFLALAPPAASAAESPIEGTWMVVKDDKSVDLNSVVTFRVAKGTVEMETVSGISYKAKVNGADAKVAGDPKADAVSVTMPRKNVFVETSKLNGQPWLSMRMEVEPGGKTAKVTWKNLQTAKGGSYEMAKQ